MTKISLKNVIEESFAQYAGAVIQSRALVDVRDCVKPSARQIYYCMFTDKFTADKPFKKTLKAIGSAMRMYIHGDSSCEGVIMRSGQPFSMRYPLVEVEGSFGNLTETGNWAAPRYTAARLSPITSYLLEDTNKYGIEEWVDNYDDTEQYPRVLSSCGFYNIVNGTTGIAVGTASSIPQFNLKEVNNALIKLLQNEDVSFDEIYCEPDFATGGIIINGEEVKASLKTGKGKAAIIRASYTIDKKNNTIIITELPYGVYTNTICSEIEKITSDEKYTGEIVGINDLTGENVCIKIYLDKKANPEAVVDFLYRNTSLQKSYSINMTMLQDGRFPKVFSWKEALQEHLNHEKKVYINCFTHQLEQLKFRYKIVKGILTAIDNIDKVIDIIRKSSSTKDANLALQNFLKIDEDQAKAILDIKLSRLARLETDKFLNELAELEKDIAHIKAILSSEKLLKKEMIARFEEVSKKFGDERRTKVVQKTITKVSTTKAAKEEVVENVVITFNPLGYLQNIPLTAYRKNSFDAFKITTKDFILLFSNQGRFFRISPKDVKSCGPRDKGTAIGAILSLEKGEKIIAAFDSIINEKRPYILFAMENGYVKKTEKAEYIGTTRNIKGMVATKLKDCEIVAIQETNGNDIMLISKEGYRIRFHADEVRASGKASLGVIGIKLGANDIVVDAKVLEKTDKTDITLTKRAGKGKKK